MALEIKVEKTALIIEDDEDALLNEAISCSRNLEIKTDDDDDESEDMKIKKENGDQSMLDVSQSARTKPMDIPWCDMESSDSSQNISDLSNGRKSDVSFFGVDAKVECDVSMHKNGDLKELSKLKHVEAPSTGERNNELSSSPARKRMREEGIIDQEDIKVTRSRKNSNSSSSTLSNNSNNKKVEYETDVSVLARRQKDIDYGKNTMGYDRYVQEIPKDARTKEHPRTPPMYMKYSRRGWDGMVKLWRKQLHAWDPQEDGEIGEPEDSETNNGEKEEGEI